MRPEEYRRLHGALDEQPVDIDLSERERQVRALAREVVSERIAPGAADRDRSGEFPLAEVRALSEAGLGGLIFPTELGGSADTTLAYAVAAEEVAAGCGSTSLVYVTQMHAAYPIFIAGSPALVERYVPPLISCEALGSLGITEPNAGSDVSSLRTSALEGDGGFVLNGSKTFITTGDRSDVIVCFATTDRSAGRGGVSAFVVDGDAKGVGRGEPFAKMGMHASSTAEVFFDRVELSADQLLGERGRGWAIVMESVIKSRVSAAAQGVGLARAAYVATRAALAELHGASLPQDVDFALATLRGRILQGRLIMAGVARQIDRTGRAGTADVAMMKQACTDLGWQVATDCMGLLGPYGDLAELGVERIARDARVTRIYDGTNEIQQLLIARDTARRHTEERS